MEIHVKNPSLCYKNGGILPLCDVLQESRQFVNSYISSHYLCVHRRKTACNINTLQNYITPSGASKFLLLYILLYNNIYNNRPSDVSGSNTYFCNRYMLRYNWS